MPRITLDEHKVSVSINDLKSSDIDRQTNWFFNACGAKFDESSNSFIFDRPPRKTTLFRILSDTKEFFESKGWTITFDQESQNLLTRQSKDALSLDVATDTGSGIKESNTVELSLPASFKRKLYDYQKKSVKHLSEVGNAANFSVPGSGKTTLSYAAYSILKSKGIVDKLLVISPRAAFVPWEEEFEECFGYSAEKIRLEGDRVDNNIISDTQGKELILSTYHLPLNHSYALSRFLEKNKVLMILDESHNIKNMNAFLGKDEGKIAEAIIDLASSATRRFILSGTPMPNKWHDVWTQFNFLWPLNEILGKSYEFKEYTGLRHDLGEKYKKIISPLFTRISKKALDLEDPVFEPIPCPMRPIQQKIYDAIELKTLKEIASLHEESITEGSKMEAWRKAKIMRLIQTASNPALLKKSDTEFNLDPISDEGLDVSELINNYSEFDEYPSKLQWAVVKTKELLHDKKEKVILWTNFVHNIDMLKDFFLKDENPFWIYGDVPKDKYEDEDFNREKMIQDFKSDPNPRVLIATPASCAESISLHMYQGKTVCKNAIYIDRTYNAGQYMQSLDRIHRIGMKKKTIVTYWLCIATNTFDERIHEKLENKRKAMHNLLDEELRIIDLDVTENLDDIKKDIAEHYEELKTFLKSKKHD